MFNHLFKAPKPTLKANAPQMIDLFSGGGGVKTGAIMAGIVPHGVEKDPDNTELSQVFSQWHNVNFAEYGSTTTVKTVQEMYLQGWQGLPRGVLWGHASPVCARFSGYSKVNDEQEDLKDITAAKAVANAIAVLDCKYWSIEQVPGYINSESFKIIISALRMNRYSFIIEPKVDFHEYGVIPQQRIRMFLLAWKYNNKPLEFPKKRKPWGWGHTLQGLRLNPNKPLKWQSEAITALSSANAKIQRPYTKLVIERVGKMNKSVKIRFSHEPMWTITKHYFHDQRKHSRPNPFNFYIPDQGYFSPHPRAIARIAGFPDWFRYPPTPYYYGSIFGYSVPPTWIYAVLSHNLTSLNPMTLMPKGV